MAHGIQVFKSSGALLLDMSYRLTRFLFHTVATAGNGGSASVPDLVAARCIGFAVGRNNAVGFKPHAVSISDGLVSWSVPGGGGNSMDSDIYVVQYK